VALLRVVEIEGGDQKKKKSDADADDKHRVPSRFTASVYGYQCHYPFGFRVRTRFNDHAIIHTSTVLNARRGLEVMLGGSLFNSPYAALDAQTMVRLTYTAGAALGGEP
jgi:hypothetical protein